MFTFWPQPSHSLPEDLHLAMAWPCSSHTEWPQQPHSFPQGIDNPELRRQNAKKVKFWCKNSKWILKICIIKNWVKIMRKIINLNISTFVFHYKSFLVWKVKLEFFAKKYFLRCYFSLNLPTKSAQLAPKLNNNTMMNLAWCVIKFQKNVLNFKKM